MKNAREHRAASLALLGYSDPRVHRLMDRHAKTHGPGHRFAGHNVGMLDQLEAWLGQRARTEGLLHILLDARIVRISNEVNK